MARTSSSAATFAQLVVIGSDGPNQIRVGTGDAGIEADLNGSEATGGGADRLVAPAAGVNVLTGDAVVHPSAATPLSGQQG